MPSVYKTCPRCGLTLAAEVTVCGRCGHHFLVEGGPLAPPPPLPDIRLPYLHPVPVPQERRQKILAISLALALGGIGIHGFYLGNKAMGATLAVMFVGGGMLAFFFFILALAGMVEMWTTSIGLAPLLIAGTIPLIQAARYGAANTEQFHQRYVVEQRWF